MPSRAPVPEPVAEPPKAEGASAAAASVEAPLSPPEPAPSAPEPQAVDASAAVVVASPVPLAAPAHAEATVRGWFVDTFNNLIATGRVREREAQAFLQDLLKRLGF